MRVVTAKTAIAIPIPEDTFVIALLDSSGTTLDIIDNFFAFFIVRATPAIKPNPTKITATGSKEGINIPKNPNTSPPIKDVEETDVKILSETEDIAFLKFSKVGLPLKSDTAYFISDSPSYF